MVVDVGEGVIEGAAVTETLKVDDWVAVTDAVEVDDEVKDTEAVEVMDEDTVGDHEADTDEVVVVDGVFDREAAAEDEGVRVKDAAAVAVVDPDQDTEGAADRVIDREAERGPVGLPEPVRVTLEDMEGEGVWEGVLHTTSETGVQLNATPAGPHTEQLVHEPAAPNEKAPTAHAVHETAAAVVLYAPAAHAVHTREVAAAVTLEYQPDARAHAVQAAEAVAAATVP